MFEKIVVPVDLNHADTLEKALNVAAGLAKTHGSTLHLVGVTPTLPGAAAHTPQEFAEKLKTWAAELAERLGVPIEAHSVPSADPQIDMDDKVLDEARKLGSDLIVMATRVPGFAEKIFSAHGPDLAAHAEMSVFLVR
ncbi:universal stress protein [Alkalilacustris brevis]|uniref:universal stress protein n=1 Tax=Alkalilacustris brevis TaxID=2026338 RepID=UPI000E0DE2CB|nr:universal stress protein [Alkalilacustris brevis]